MRSAPPLSGHVWCSLMSDGQRCKKSGSYVRSHGRGIAEIKFRVCSAHLAMLIRNDPLPAGGAT
jgi:hypothetical protein